MVSTRPEIAYAVGVGSWKLENPSPEDTVRVKRIFRYLKGTEEMRIVYNSGNSSPLHIVNIVIQIQEVILKLDIPQLK